MSVVEYRAPCDRCGSAAWWTGRGGDMVVSGTVYEVFCPECGGGDDDQPDEAADPPAQLPSAPVSLTRLTLYRLMNAALNRRSA